MRSDGYENAAALLPGDIRAAALALPAALRGRAEEFRLRCGRPPALLLPEGERALIPRGVTERDLGALLETATRSSVHTALGQLRAGFVTVRGGVRVGLAGVVNEDGGSIALRRVSSAAVRIPRAALGCADGIIGPLTRPDFENTLILAPPGGGKTTMLRELVRLLGGTRRVSLVDERGEAAGVFESAPEFDVGSMTDVMTGIDKRRGAELMLRAMNPEIIAFDEITCPDDAEACRLALGCGVRILATAHAAGTEDLRAREVYRELTAAGAFRRAVVISRAGGERRAELREI